MGGVIGGLNFLCGASAALKPPLYAADSEVRPLSTHLVKKALWILVPCLAGLVVAFLGLRSCGRQFWERTLHGPFTGIAYTGSITSSPASVLAIPSRGQLEVHESQSRTNPIVLLRSASGDIQWSRLFIPQKNRQDGTVEHAGLRELRLLSWERRSTGSVVRVSCDWDWGGREGGLIALDTNYGFKSFSLSW